jgi:hypothetical protein
MVGNHAVLNNFLTWIGIDLEVRTAIYAQGVEDF